MNHYCTLFDSNYLIRGLAMHDSLVETGEQFSLYVICFDDLARRILENLRLPQVFPIALANFETPELLTVKGDRTKGEYCWTCTPYVIRYVLDTYQLEEVTYIDADLYFFKNPAIILNEFHKSKGSVLITEHRYTSKYDQTTASGIYCVQFITFRADDPGLRILQWWQDRCLEWCYARCEDGKFGDQKYLDNWPVMFSGVHVLQHLGGGVAPWNIQQYRISEGPHINGVPVIFYHFHDLKWYFDDRFDLGNYGLPPEAITFIYEPYLTSLKKQLHLIQSVENNFNQGKEACLRGWKASYRNLKRLLKGGHNIVQK